jgi:hypothetical protein
MYHLDHHTESKSTCSAEGPAVTDPNYMRVYLDTLGSLTQLHYAFCTSTDVSTCADEFLIFDDVDGSWIITAATSASYSGGSCSLFHAEGSAARDGAAGVRLEIKQWDIAQTIPQSQCTVDAAAALSSMSACDDHVVAVGSPVN